MCSTYVFNLFQSAVWLCAQGHKRDATEQLHVQCAPSGSPSDCSLAIVPHAEAALDDEVQKLKCLLEQQGKK